MSYSGRVAQSVVDGARSAIGAVEKSRAVRAVAGGAVVLGMAALSLLSPYAGGEGKADAQNGRIGRITVEDDSVAEASPATPITVDSDEKLVEAKMADQVAGLVDKGADQVAAERVVDQNASVFFAGGENGKINPEKVKVERGKIFEERPDGVCLIEAYDGKVVREFGHSDFEEGMSGDEVKNLAIESLCPTGEVSDGVNLPQVAQTLALQEALKTGADINDVNVLAELTNRHLDVLETGSVQEVQALYETAKIFLEGSATFGAPELSADRYESLFVDADGNVHGIDVDGKAGAMQSPVTIKGVNEKGEGISIVVDWGECGQIRIAEAPTPPVVEVPPAPPARAVAPPARPVVAPPAEMVSTPETVTVTTVSLTGSVHLCFPDGSGGYTFEDVPVSGPNQASIDEQIADLIGQYGEENCIGTTTTEVNVTTTTGPPPTTSPPPTTTSSVPESSTTTSTTEPQEPEETTTTTTAPDKHAEDANNSTEDHDIYLDDAVEENTTEEQNNHQGTRPDSTVEGAGVLGVGVGAEALRRRRRNTQRVRFQLPDGTWTWVESNV